ncbi:hypothetical protein SAMN04488511_101150 [Pedobacter suwonensis]|uniref:HNH endonuclease n=2 Tax=Pedobacter suwonensis TaxID=332999 RepID=A0A1I0SHK1_9SPHI|nr:hypothetical protein SAMN04488511_101150 [Pedobacter suwonensis]
MQLSSWLEAINQAFEDLNGRGTELEILHVIQSNQYLSFENSKTPQRSLNLYLNRDFKGQAVRQGKYWINLNPEFATAQEQETFHQIKRKLSANSVKNILALEQHAKQQTPMLKMRLSRYIERGAIATKVKALTNYQCMICASLNLNPYSFKKLDGTFYVEAHHVEQVANLKLGALSVENIITVCATHHRQLHYGKVILLENGTDSLIFQIEEKVIKLDKIKLKD